MRREAAGLMLLLCLGLASQSRAQVAPTPAETTSTLRPVSFAKVGYRIAAGTPWARIQVDDLPLVCRNQGTLRWDGKDNGVFSGADLEQTFRDELRKAGIRVTGDPTNLFEQDQKSSDLQVGALVTGVKATFCERHSYAEVFVSSSKTLISGSVDMEIEWQVYSTLQGRVVARVPTTGSSASKSGIDAGEVVLIRNAFADSARAFALSPELRQALAAPASAAGPQTPIAVRFGTAAKATPAEASASVAIVFAGEGMGSGFLISPDGYLMTNHHVVGDAQRVRVRWLNNAESVGEVIRSDRRRDVALIKVEPSGHRALGLRTAAAMQGETVYAIGTPLEKDFQNTITRGVVSGSRVIEGLAFVQSDVAVDHGNSGGPLLDEAGQVIAITASGYAPDGVSHNINFFIPIGDALKALAIQPAR